MTLDGNAGLFGEMRGDQDVILLGINSKLPYSSNITFNISKNHWRFIFFSSTWPQVELPPNDLSPPRALNETLKLMKDIFETQDMLQASERHDNLVQVII